MQRLRDLALEVLNEYQLLSQEFGSYQKTSGLNCVEGCGACCNNPQVEASVLEMLPLALHLFDTGQAEAYLQQMHDSGGFACHLFLFRCALPCVSVRRRQGWSPQGQGRIRQHQPSY